MKDTDKIERSHIVKNHQKYDFAFKLMDLFLSSVVDILYFKNI
jgi:hypothetical protein